MVAEPLRAFEEPCLSARVFALCEEHAALWAATSENLPVLGPRVGFRQHFANARAAARLIDELASEVVCVPSAEDERRAWRETVRERLQRFGDARLGWPAGYRRLLFADAFFAASEAFAREARTFDPDLTFDSLYQALRNVWIGNSLQMLLDLPVTLGPGLFAYSMLYPVTDNFLDDPRVPGKAKRAFNERLGRRLAGLSIVPRDAHEAAMCQLADRIEQQFPRRAFTDVYESLLAIHGAQVRSLSQQRGEELADDDLVAISLEKGGSSVLADLYLVAGTATVAQERFAFGYGVVLQLLDDLQDVEHDAAAGHETLFTRAARRGPLDDPTARLVNLIDCVLDAEPFAAEAFADRKDLIRRNCRTLLVGAVADQPSRFTRRFRRSISQRWPIGFRALRRLRRRAARRYREATRELQRRTGAASPVEWLLAQRA